MPSAPTTARRLTDTPVPAPDSDRAPDVIAADHLWSAQGRIVGATTDFATGWLARRSAALEALLLAQQQVALTAATQPGAAMQALTDWQVGVAARLTDDMTALSALMTTCATAMIRGEVETLRDTAQIAKRATQTCNAHPV